MTTVNVSVDQVLRSSYTRHGYDRFISDLEATLVACGLHVDVVEGSTDSNQGAVGLLEEPITSTSLCVGTREYKPSFQSVDLRSPWEVVIHDEGSVLLPDYDLYYYHEGAPLLVGRGLVSYTLLVGMLLSPVVYEA